MNNNNIFMYFFSNLIKIKNNFHIILYNQNLLINYYNKNKNYNIFNLFFYIYFDL